MKLNSMTSTRIASGRKIGLRQLGSYSDPKIIFIAANFYPETGEILRTADVSAEKNNYKNFTDSYSIFQSMFSLHEDQSTLLSHYSLPTLQALV